MTVPPARSRFFAPLGRDLQRLGLGTVRFRLNRQDEAFEVLDTWADLGGDLIDTAAVYGGGESERVVGAWIAANGVRERVVILTKGAHPDEAWRSRLNPATIEADLTESLKRLGTDHIDVYMVHRDDPAVPVSEIVDALDSQVRRGRARSVGASNWATNRLDEAAAYAAESGRIPLSSSSVYFGLAVPTRPLTPGCLDGLDPESRAWYATGPPMFAWSAQSSGYFDDRFDGTNASFDVRPIFDTSDNRERRERARAVGQRTGFTAAQVALAWVLGQPFRPYALVGARDSDSVRAAWRTFELDLAPDEHRWLELDSEGLG
jgi:aryl-alcohol dehydrogenase-like predicted oxidoreductase